MERPVENWEEGIYDVDPRELIPHKQPDLTNWNH